LNGFFFSLILAVIPATVASADTTADAMQWVQKMSEAMQQLSYKGRFIYLHDKHLESMSVHHINDDQGIRERLVSLNGEAREILRDNTNLTCIWPSSRQVVVDQANSKVNASPLWIPDDVARLGKFYHFKLSGKDRIADHPAVVVSIQPKDQFRYGMQVWIDEDNGLLLQSNLLDEQGRIAEQVMFTEIELLSDDERQTFSVSPQVEHGYALIRSHEGGDDAVRLPADQRWQIQDMPGGFWLKTSFRKKMMSSPDYTQHMVFTDGMAYVSVFIEKNTDDGLSGESSMGAINAYGSRYQDYTITAIGEVPAITVKHIAESLVYQN
jgi:sigma-E factor negative regulatory protein RseB